MRPELGHIRPDSGPIRPGLESLGTHSSDIAKFGVRIARFRSNFIICDRTVPTFCRSRQIALTDRSRYFQRSSEQPRLFFGDVQRCSDSVARSSCATCSCFHGSALAAEIWLVGLDWGRRAVISCRMRGQLGASRLLQIWTIIAPRSAFGSTCTLLDGILAGVGRIWPAVLQTSARSRSGERCSTSLGQRYQSASTICSWGAEDLPSAEVRAFRRRATVLGGRSWSGREPIAAPRQGSTALRTGTSPATG